MVKFKEKWSVDSNFIVFGSLYLYYIDDIRKGLEVTAWCKNHIFLVVNLLTRKQSYITKKYTKILM